MSAPYKPGGMRRFRLARARGGPRTCVAQGVVFWDGTVVLRWLGNDASTITFTSLATMETVHVHDETWIRWEDFCCFVCGTECGPAVGPGWCSACGATWDEPASMPEPAPSARSWRAKTTTAEPELEAENLRRRGRITDLEGEIAIFQTVNAELEEENAHFRAAAAELEDDPTAEIDEADRQAGRRRAARKRTR